MHLQPCVGGIIRNVLQGKLRAIYVFMFLCFCSCTGIWPEVRLFYCSQTVFVWLITLLLSNTGLGLNSICICTYMITFWAYISLFKGPLFEEPLFIGYSFDFWPCINLWLLNVKFLFKRFQILVHSNYNQFNPSFKIHSQQLPI